MSTVSLVLPVHNGERYLESSLESCLSQTHRDLELIVVLDACTDKSADIVETYRRRDSRIRILANSTALKLPGALNAGFACATGELLSWTSDDNLFHPTALERLVAVLHAHPALGLVYADYQIIGSQGDFLRASPRSPAGYIIEGNCVGACFLYRRQAMERVGHYSEATFLAEDYDYWLRMYLQGIPMAHLPETLYDYRVHARSLGETHGKSEVDQMAERVRRRHLSPPRREWLRLVRRLDVIRSRLTGQPMAGTVALWVQVSQGSMSAAIPAHE